MNSFVMREQRRHGALLALEALGAMSPLVQRDLGKQYCCCDRLLYFKDSHALAAPASPLLLVMVSFAPATFFT
jgi:hypothetical protein